MKFQKAQRKRAKLRLALTGPSGSGKTYSALLLAQGLGGKIAVIDTERGSASLYSDLVEFDTLELNPPYAPERFVEALMSAAGAGYDICIIDSITHEWNGSGGCLEINEQIAQAKYKGNTWSAWSDTTPRHRDFLDAILQSPMHVIATMRSKTETVASGTGSSFKAVKVGMKAETREGAEYEFAIVFDLEHANHYAVASKDRTRLFPNSTPFVITRETGKKILDWLDSGAELAPIDPVREPLTVDPRGDRQPMEPAKLQEVLLQLDEPMEKPLSDRDANHTIWNIWSKLTQDEQSHVWDRLKDHHRGRIETIKGFVNQTRRTGT